MTWVFGNANILGSAICVADIQVTLQDGRAFDCVQKLHELDRNVLAGFAGDVLTGFAMLVSLNRYLLGQDAPIEIERVFDTFQAISRNVFAQVPGANQAQGSEILIAGASAVDSAMYGSRAQVARFASPDFNAEIVPRGEWGSIGSGSDVAQYRTELEAVTGDDVRALMPLEANSPGGFANAMVITIVDNVFHMPAVSGISKHFHVGVVFAHGCNIRTSNRTYFPTDGPPQHIEMPEVARTWAELQGLLERQLGRAITVARA